MTLPLPEWRHDGILIDGGVLAVSPAYLTIRGGRARWLDRVARKGSVAAFLGGRAGAADRHLQAAAPNRAATKALWAGMSLAGIAEIWPSPTMAMIS